MYHHCNAANIITILIVILYIFITISIIISTSIYGVAQGHCICLSSHRF